MTQTNFLNSILERLINNFAFYLPKEIIPEIVLEDLKGKISQKIFDRLSILDIYHGIGEFETLEFNERLYIKRELLEQTIFQLLKKRKELEHDEFTYLIDKYFRQVKFYLAIANWMRLNTANFKRINKQTDLSTKGSFELQFEAINVHIMELVNHFYKGKELNIIESFTAEEILRYYLQDFSRIFQQAEAPEIEDPTKLKNQSEVQKEETENQGSSITGNSRSSTIQEKKEPPQKVKKEKRPMVTEKEAQDFLLTSVFSVDPIILKK